MSQKKTIINLVDQISKVNYGIWHAAVATSDYLFELYGIESWLVAPESEETSDLESFKHLKIKRLINTGSKSARIFFSDFNTTNTMVVSHGVWQYPTHWGNVAKNMGFKWIYTPHGMLEPWSMSQKWLKKKLYFNLVEKRLALKSNVVRAVGAPEAANLRKVFHNVVHIPNGIYENDILKDTKPGSPITFLFLARLHHKKGVVDLVKAWLKSEPGQSEKHQLLIAGTDDGEQTSLETLISVSKPKNIKFLGPQFGAAKSILLKKSHFYILPSRSEGFPTSVVEAMAAGLIPIITDGCNFPEAFENGVALRTSPDESSILDSLNISGLFTENEINEWSTRARLFVEDKYLWSRIAEQQALLFGKLLTN
jgi:glycosyltransferase involved in cell wall biosynthesis